MDPNPREYTEAEKAYNKGYQDGCELTRKTIQESKEFKQLLTIKENIAREYNVLRLKLEEANKVRNLRYFTAQENINDEVFKIEEEIRALERLYIPPKAV
jgi:hypothetical protein